MSSNRMIGSYVQPRTMEELTECQWRLGACNDYKIVAGGTDYMVERRATHETHKKIVSLSHMDELKEINCDGSTLFIGSMATHAQIASNYYVNRYFPGLAEACGQVGSMQIRNRGTIGGNIVTNSPGSDTIPCLYLFDAQLVVLRASGTGEVVPIDEFLHGLGKLYHGDIVLGVMLPIDPDLKSTYIKLARRDAVSIAEISMAVSWHMSSGKITAPRAFFGAIARTPVEFAAISRLEGLEPAEAREESDLLSNEAEAIIRAIREERKSAPRLRITEAERLYKEYAVCGVICDMLAKIR